MEQYQTPVLKIYGDMKNITLSTAGSVGDCFFGTTDIATGDGADIASDSPADIDGIDPNDGFDNCND